VYISHEPTVLFGYCREMRPKEYADVGICVKFLQGQAIGRSEGFRYGELSPDVFLDSASEEKPKGKWMVTKSLSDDLDKLLNQIFIITFIESVDDDDHRPDVRYE